MTDNIIKNFTRYVSTNVLGMIGLSCYILGDTFFIAKALGTDGIASLNFCIPIYCIISGLGLMIGIGGSIKYTIFKSQQKNQQANAIFTHSLIFGIIIGVIFLIVGVFFSVPISKLLGADSSILQMTNSYLLTILLFSPFFIVNNTMLAFIRNDGNPSLSMMAMLAGSFSNIILDYIFLFPIPMGMFGAALATGLAPIISLGVLSLHFLRKKNSFTLAKCLLKIKYIKDIASLGFSAFIVEASSGLVLIVFNLVILGLAGKVGVAAYGIVANIALVVIAIFTGIAQGIQPMLSGGHGTGDTRLLSKVLYYATILSFGVATIVYFLVFWYTSSIIAVFNSENNQALSTMAEKGFVIYFLGFFFAGLNIISAAFLSAVENPKEACFISLTRGCFTIIPIVLILPLFLSMDGVWLSFVLAEFIAFVLVLILLWRYKKRCVL